MSDIVELPAQPRERAGKGPARATRRTGRVPGVIYGAKKDPNLISVEERLLTKLLHQGGFFSILFDVKVDGDRKSTRLNSSQYCATRMPSSALQKKRLNTNFTHLLCSP